MEGVVWVFSVTNGPGGRGPVEEGLEEGVGFALGEGGGREDACGGVEGVEG